MNSHTPQLGIARVERLSHDGRGVARVAGKTLFIEGALPGEEVRFRVTKCRARYDEATTVEILQASPHRVVPPCPHYGRCGGCNLQHLAPAAQLGIRQQHLVDALERIAGLSPARWLDPVPGEPWAYRARARLAIDSGHGRVAPALGFRREGSKHVEALDCCPVLTNEASALLRPLTQLLGELEHPNWLQEAWLASGEPGLALGLSCTRATPHPADVERLRTFCAAHNVKLQIGTVIDGQTRWPEQAEALSYHTGCEDVRLHFQPWQFTQANRGVNRALIALVGELLQPQPADRLLDLFCGLGNFSLPLARRVAQVTGIEGEAAAIESARNNARLNGIGNVEFLRANLAQDPGASAWARGRYELIVLDPPRAGAAALVPALLKLRPRRICYISCDPATLARDARKLCAGGKIELLAAGVLDMFPQTSHCESIALFG